MSAERAWPEVGRDALDPPASPRPPRRWLPPRRLALGVGDTVAPSLVFITIGMAAGPSGAHLLSQAVLDRLSPLVTVALAVIGVFVGLGTTTIPRPAARQIFAAGSVSAALTILVTSAGLTLLFAAWAVPLPVPPLAAALVLGVAASASAVAHVGRSPVTQRVIAVADADDIPLILLGSLAVAMLTASAASDAAWRLAITLVCGAGIGVAGWLLFERATGTPERGVFVTGAILLLAGTATYLGTSPLLTGFVAALVWVRAPGTADRIGAADLRVIQHPLLAVLLIVAGAMIEWTPLVVWATVATVLLRVAAKILASLIVGRVVGVRPGLLATALLPPGVLGIGFALNVGLLVGTDARLLVGVATATAGVSELLAMLLPAELEAEP